MVDRANVKYGYEVQLNCEHCAASVREELGQIGLTHESVAVNLTGKGITIEAPRPFPFDEVQTALEETGLDFNGPLAIAQEVV